MMQEPKIEANYDEEHDIMYFNVGEPEPSYSDGVEPGVHVRSGMFDELITGAKLKVILKKQEAFSKYFAKNF